MAFVFPTWRVEMQFSVGVWTDVRLDIVAAESIRWQRGAQANGPRDRIAQPGLFEFSLRNDPGNSGAKQGYYSPGHTNCRSGFTEGIPVRIIGTYNAVDYPLWRGRLRSILPDPGIYRSQRTHCTAQDGISDLTDTDVRAIAPQVNKTETQLLAAVLAALPTEVQPPATNFDSGLDVVPYAFDNIGVDGAPDLDRGDAEPHDGRRSSSPAARPVRSVLGCPNGAIRRRPFSPPARPRVGSAYRPTSFSASCATAGCAASYSSGRRNDPSTVSTDRTSRRTSRACAGRA